MKLSTICNIQSGGTPARSKKEYWENGNIPWVKIGDFKGKYLSVTDETITTKGLECSAAKIFPKGTLLYTIFATLGEVCILDIEAATNQAIAGIQIKNDSVEKEYLYYFLVSLKEQVNRIGRGVAQNNINMSILRDIEVPLPERWEQQQIAKTLDQVDLVISKRREQLAKLDGLVKARFVEMFGDPKDNAMDWSVYSLGDLFKVSSSKRIYQNEQVPEGVPFLRISDLMNRIEKADKTAELFISEELYEKLKDDSLVPLVGDILVTSRGTLGQCYEIREHDRFYFQDGMISWLYDRSSKISNNYLMHLFQMPGFRVQIDETPAGSTVNYLSIARIKNLKIMCPSIECQQQFADFVSQVDKSKAAVERSLASLEMLKRSLMQQYFG